MDNVLKQQGVDCILSAPYHPQSNGKVEVSHKYLKATLKKLCENDPNDWEKYLNQVLASYRCDATPCNCCNTLLTILWKRFQSTPPLIAGTHAVIPG